MVPIAERHALSVGIFTHLEKLHFGLYADREVFPQLSELPSALDASLGELLEAQPRRCPLPLARSAARSAILIR